jgi:hypothetical protein
MDSSPFRSSRRKAQMVMARRIGSQGFFIDLKFGATKRKRFNGY